MAHLSRVQFNWKLLDKALNSIIDAINANEPISGQGISIDEKGSSGKMISATPQGKTAADNSSQGGGGGGGAGAGGNWQTVTIVDPTTCNKFQIQVWSRSVP